MYSNVNTPLRYPGGKSVLSDYFDHFIKCNQLKSSIYAEPYCGGAGAAVSLLRTNSVDKILLNDADAAIYSFWYSIKHFGDEFLNLLDTTPVNLEEWHNQKIIFENTKHFSQDIDMVKQGFATFYLNRCNRSGILKAGPIGGRQASSQMNANYKIDARFKHGPLKLKLKSLIELSSNIEVYNLDALTFLRDVVNKQSFTEQRNTFVYLDPPYYNQGSSLYLNYYKPSDHEDLRNFLVSDKNEFKWLLSYDNVNPIKELYRDFNIYTYYVNYSAQESKLGSELLIPSKNSIIPETRIIKKLKRSNRQIELYEL